MVADHQGRAYYGRVRLHRPFCDLKIEQDFCTWWPWAKAFGSMGDLLVASKPYVAVGGSMPMISEYRDEHFAGVEALWQEAFPHDAAWNKASVAIPEKMRFQPDLMLVAHEGPLVAGSVMAGYEGHRGWISRIAVLKAHRHKGIGQALLAEAERRLGACPRNRILLDDD
jgi:ribosomal protein S18 acetylase RimI-like enzyme